MGEEENQPFSSPSLLPAYPAPSPYAVSLFSRQSIGSFCRHARTSQWRSLGRAAGLLHSCLASSPRSSGTVLAKGSSGVTKTAIPAVGGGSASVIGSCGLARHSTSPR